MPSFADLAGDMAEVPEVAAPVAAPKEPTRTGRSFFELAGGGASKKPKGTQSTADVVTATTPPQQASSATPEPESWVDKYVRGPIEAAASTATGLVAAPIGQLAGLGYGVTHGYGTDEGVRNAAGVADNVSQSLTYQPRGSAGQRYAGNVGETMANLVPFAGISGEMAALGRASTPIRSIGGDISAQLKGAPPVADVARIEPTMASTVINPAKPRFKMTANGPVPVPPTAEAQILAQFDTKNQSTKVDPSLNNAAGTAPTLADTPAPFRKAVQGAANDATLQRKIEAQSLPVPIELTQGQATKDIHQISFEQNNRGKIQAFGDRFREQNVGLAQNLDAVREASAPDVHTTGVATNQALVDSIKGIDAPLRADISAKYQALKDANGGEFPLSGSDFVGSADAALKRDNVSRFIPPEVKGMLDDLREGGPMNYNDFENFRTILGQQERKAARAGDGTAEHAIGVVRNSLESIPMSNETAAIKPLADAARNAAAARFAKIKADPAYKAAVNDGVALGEPSPIADGFIGKYVIGGKTANVKSLSESLSNDPMARQLIAAGVMDHLKTASGIDVRTNTGNVNQAGLNKAISGLDQKRDIIFDPKSSQHVDTIGRVAQYTQEQPKGSYVNNSNTTVSAIANGAKELALGALNVKTLGASGFVRGQVESAMQKKAVKNSLSHSAGTTKLSDFPP